MTAEKLTSALETLPPGEPWAESFATADDAINAALSVAAGVLVPLAIPPTTGDAIEQYTFLIDRLPIAGYGDALAQVHERALASNPALAALCRSQEALSDVEVAAARLAAPMHERETHATAAARAAANARAAYMLAIATQLAATPGHELAKPARAFVAAEALARRAAAAKLRHEEHARTEIDHVQEQRRAAYAAAAADRARRVQEAADVAAAAGAEAVRAQRAARQVRADALIEGLREQLARTNRPERLWLQTATGGHSVETIIANANWYSEEQLGFFEGALAKGRFEVDSSPVDPWRRA